MTDFNKTDTVILCGGLGKRLASVLSDRQKVMAELDGIPFLDYILDHVEKQGLKRVILCTGHHAEQVEEYYKKNKRSLRIEFSKEEAPLGTGGAIKQAFTKGLSDPAFVLNGDSFCPIDLRNFLDFYVDKKALACMAVAQVNASGDFGGIRLGEDGKILSFQEKSISGKGFVNAGVYCFGNMAVAMMPDQATFSMEHVCFPEFIKEGFYGFRVDSFWDIGTPERFKEVQEKINNIKS